ncbi:MAG: GNAT family N-acetyltransferase [Spirochaetes bacterium]|nr:MAG: GNAT family N-acetyltransferase [Spirochaetota bacterium]
MPSGVSDHEITVRTALRPGDAGKIIALHGLVYADEHGFDHTFEAYIAEPLAHFITRNSPRERIWIADRRGDVAGSIALVDEGRGAGQLRWFILDRDARGKGLGATLLENLIAFAAEQRYERIMLWTLDILPAALRLYTGRGFVPKEERASRLWGRDLTEMRFELELA